MQVIISINHDEYCERLIMEKSPMQDAYKFHIEVAGRTTYTENHIKFSRKIVVDFIKSVRRVAGKDSVTIK